MDRGTLRVLPFFSPFFVLFLFAAGLGPAFAEPWSDAQEAEVKALFRDQGFYPTLQQVLHGTRGPGDLKSWVARVDEASLVGTTVRDTLASLPGTADPWLAPLLAGAPPGSERAWVADRRRDKARVAGGKFHLSLLPVRMDLLPGVSMILPNYDWSISYQDSRQMTVQALEKGYAATLHLRWIDRDDLDVFDTTRLLQMYAGFRPLYIVHKPAGEPPAEGDLVPLPETDPQPLAGDPKVLEQVQVGAPDAWQLYAGRTRWYPAGRRVLVVMLSVHVERDRLLADRDRESTKIAQLLDTLRVNLDP